MLTALLIAAAPVQYWTPTRDVQTRMSDKSGCYESRHGNGKWETVCIGAEPKIRTSYHYDHERTYEWEMEPSKEACYSIGLSPCLTVGMWRRKMLELERSITR